MINANRYQYSSESLGFRAGYEYHVRVRARNFITEYYSLVGTWSATATFYSSILPQTISGLSYDNLTKVGSTIRWTLLSSEAQKGYSTTQPVYTLEMDDCKNGAFSNVLLVSTSATFYTISSLTPGITCRYRMKVDNIIGTSPYSDILSVHYAEVTDAPLAPKYVTRFGGDSTIDLSPYITVEWEAPFETNGAPVLGYKVEISMNTGAY